jgi:hypothetical protein
VLILNSVQRPGLCDVAIVRVNAAWQVIQKLTNEPTAQPMFYPAISQNPLLAVVVIIELKKPVDGTIPNIAINKRLTTDNTPNMVDVNLYIPFSVALYPII